MKGNKKTKEENGVPISVVRPRTVMSSSFPLVRQIHSEISTSKFLLKNIPCQMEKWDEFVLFFNIIFLFSIILLYLCILEIRMSRQYLLSSNSKPYLSLKIVCRWICAIFRSFFYSLFRLSLLSEQSWGTNVKTVSAT